MFRKTVSAIMLTLLLMSMLTLSFSVQPVKAEGTIYIRADGSIDPPTAPISTVDNVTYTLTDSINSSIVVERDSVMVDGARYTVQGTGSGYGIYLSGRSNVTIKNMNITAFWYGVRLDYSSDYNSVIGNNITANLYSGIQLYYSSNDSIIGNDITTPWGFGIGLNYSSSNTISGNNVTYSPDGIGLSYSSDYNIVTKNNIANNGMGIHALYSSGNSIDGNTITANNDYGIVLSWSSDNRLYHNNINNSRQVAVYPSVYANFWDDGYPAGGNYWSDYNGTDVYSGPYQNETGSDGISDTPYVINGDNRDNYPFTNSILVNLIGDITGPNGWPDGKVDMRDVSLVAMHFRETVPPAPANCDLTGPTAGVPDGRIDMRDVGLVARHFGEHL